MYEETVTLGSTPLRVAENCWMVGQRDPSSLLQCNAYLRNCDDGVPFRVCVDPGSCIYYRAIAANIGQLIGDVSELDAFSLNHQDPDVVGNAPHLCAANPEVQLLVTEDVWRLARHLDFTPGRIEFANPGRNSWFRVGNRRLWQLVPTPFCHFRGAMAFYDPEIRTLFSGDLFGGFNQLGRTHLFAESNDWAGIAQFHQIYMPSRDVLRHAVQQIRALDPAVEIIAPQHGHVIAGEQVPLFLERMEQLLVGHDLLCAEWDETHLVRYQETVNGLLEWAGQFLDHAEIQERLIGAADQNSKPLFEWDDRRIRLRHDGYHALLHIFLYLTRDELPEFVQSARGCVLQLCAASGIPVPPIGTGIEG